MMRMPRPCSSIRRSGWFSSGMAVSLNPSPWSAMVNTQRAASARTVMLVVTGEAKKALLEKAIEDGALSSLPVGRVLAEIDMAVDIHWCP